MTPTILRLALAGALGLAAAPAAFADVEIVTVDGRRVRGEIREIAPGQGAEPPKLVLLRPDGTLEPFGLDSIVELLVQGSGAAGARDVEAVLSTGETIWGTLEAPEGDQGLRIRSASVGTVTVRLDQVRWVRFPARGGSVPPEDRVPPGGDILFMRDGTQTPAGTIERLDGTSVVASAAGIPEIRKPLGDVAAIYVAPIGEPPAAPPGSLSASLEGVDGSFVRGRIESFRDGLLGVETVSGLRLKVPVSGLSSVSFAGGRFDYLSDLVPVRVRERPNLYDPVVEHARDPSAERPRHFPPGTCSNYFPDRAYRGENSIRLGGKVHRKGIGAHSWVEITYAIGKRYRLFTATIGLDDSVKDLQGEVNERGSVIFRVLLDGTEKARFGPMVGSDKPREIEVNVSGAETLSLVVDYTGDPDPPKFEDTHIRDRADFGSARVIK
ncbi:MAG: NPCBM/NEW2 domain-containing protein [Planctomycetales bacterium]|nr:NPCBM/NEW2 domain-containing protein [Planctomycetales bacterium]